MSQKTFCFVAGFLYLLVALMHALRLVERWRVTFGDLAVPVWFGHWAALVVTGFLAYQGLRLSRRR